MSSRFAFGLLVGSALLAACAPAGAIGILSPADSIIAIDFDPPGSNSSYPTGEAPGFAIDGMLAKYLNFAGAGSGLIVTPNLAAASVAEGIRLTTANDGETRDPTSYEVWGTNDAITSADNSTGLDENWTLISSGGVSLPSSRDTVGDLISFANADLYTSYKVVFPTNKGSTLFQIAEVELLGDVPSLSVFDADLFSAGDPTIAIHLAPDSNHPGGEGPSNLLDGDAGTKYLNFGKANSGFIVTPAIGSSTVRSFQISTANDFPERDPTSWELYGTNDSILSEANSQGDGESWTLIDSGSITLPSARQADGPFVLVDNDNAYTSYRMVFPTLVDNSGNYPADSMQISGVQFYEQSIPEPAAGALALAAVALLAARRK